MKFIKSTELLAMLCAMFLAPFLLSRCVHEPIETIPGGGGNPIDTTTTGGDTTKLDTTNTGGGTGGTPCDSTKVYFEQQILPILLSNCAMSGCHDAASHQDGVVLNNYTNTVNTAKVRPGNPNNSELYEVLVDNDPDDRMPPPPSAKLPQDQISLIYKWIQQGAQNLSCDPNAGGCDTTQVAYSSFVQPLINTYCRGCHSGSAPLGGISLTTHAQVKAQAANGKLLGSVKHSTGFSPMPKNAAKLNACYIQKIGAWVKAGALDN